MGDIYRNAELVVVLLSPSSNQNNRALEIIRHLATVYDWSSTSEITRVQSSDPEYAYGKPLPYNSEDWLCLHDLFGLPWFRRVWTRQEITLANKAAMMIGREELDWATFRRVSMCIKTKMWKFPAPRVPTRRTFAIDLRTTWSAHSLSKDLSLFTTFFQFIGWTGISECKDKRDYVYGVLDLCDLDITPD